MKILITGGSGFIGTNLISFFEKFNHQILSIDIKAPKVASHNRYWKDVDLCDNRNLSHEIKSFSPEVVIHLGARTDLRGKTLADYRANIEGVESLLSTLDEIPTLRKVIFTSSMYVCRPGYVPQDFNDYAPHTVYGQSKVLTEQIIKKRNPSYSWSLIRPTSLWGPFFGEPYDLFFKFVLSKKYFHLGKRACKKTYGYIDNAIYQIDSILKASNEVTNKKVFYLGDYKPYNITEWANEIAACVNKKIKTVPYFLFVIAACIGDVLHKLKVDFPMTSFRLKNMTTDNTFDLRLIESIAPSLPISRLEGIKKTISWIKANS